MVGRRENPLLATWIRMLAVAGAGEGRLLSEQYDSGHFGDGETSFQLGSIVLRLLRDRGEDFVDVAPSSAPADYFRWDDVCVAFGWRKIDDVVARTHPVPLEADLAEIVRRASDLETAFAAEQLPSTRKVVREAAARREGAFLEKLGRLADRHDKA